VNCNRDSSNVWNMFFSNFFGKAWHYWRRFVPNGEGHHAVWTEQGGSRNSSPVPSTSSGGIFLRRMENPWFIPPCTFIVHQPKGFLAVNVSMMWDEDYGVGFLKLKMRGHLEFDYMLAKTLPWMVSFKVHNANFYRQIIIYECWRVYIISIFLSAALEWH
jgi:hypothetical protein